MNAHLQPTTLAEVGHRLVEHGYNIIPIPPGDKRPGLDGWTAIRANASTVDRWIRRGMGGQGVGILAENTPGVDLDVSDPVVLEEMLRWCQQHIGVENTRVGRAPRTLIACFTSAPFSKLKSRVYADPSGTEHHVEILGRGQQYVAYAVHPDTQKPYAWSGNDPLVVPTELLPSITVEKARALIAHFEANVPPDWTVVARSGATGDGEVHEGHSEKTAEIARIRAAVEFLPNENWHYDDYVKVMYAIWAGVGDDKEAGRQLFLDWAAKAVKFDPEKSDYHWSAIKKVDRIGARSLFKMAFDAGWDGRVPGDFENIGAILDDEESGDQPDGDKPTDTAADDLPEPVDLWGRFEPPALPRGLLPPVIEQFAFVHGESMGADPAGLAAAALSVCAAAIPDTIQIQMKVHSDWKEAARLWVALVGQPSTKKSPIIDAAAKPLEDLERRHAWEYQKKRAVFDALPPDAKKLATVPKRSRLVVNDVTTEAMQEILKDSRLGVLMLHDELAGWFGSMEKYSGARGSGKDRAFWLECFGGKSGDVDRIGRGSVYLPNKSVCLLGGIQPAVARDLLKDQRDDGLIQRIFPIMLRPAMTGADKPTEGAVRDYRAVVATLREATTMADIESEGDDACVGAIVPEALRFDSDGQQIYYDVEAWVARLVAVESINPKLGSHIGKLGAMFGRLCVTWHVVENAPNIVQPVVSGDTARRVFEFMRCFLLPHAACFFSNLGGFSDDHESVAWFAGHLLAHPEKDFISTRDVMRSGSALKNLDNDGKRRLLEQLEFLGWLLPAPKAPNGTAPRWRLNPKAAEKYAERAKAEEIARAHAREVIAEIASASRERPQMAA